VRADSVEPPDVAWRELGRDVRAFVGRRVRDAHAADDIAQDVLTKFARQVATAGRPDDAAAWLFTAARNAVVDFWRRQRPTDGVDVDALAAEAPAADDLDCLRRSFRTFVHGLPGPYREALLLTEYEGLTQQQLADRLGIPLSTAKSRVQRAKKQLAEALHRCCTFELDRRGGILDYHPRAGGDCTDCR